jgi:enoyl-CoA hydratase/carnithine racemase
MSERSTSGQAPELHIDSQVATITLRRPEVANRLELSDLDTVSAQVAQVNATPGVLVLRLRGEGRYFCSGFNIDKVGGTGADAGARFEALAGMIEQARPVTVAQIHGGVYGGATDLALACDFRFGTVAAEMQVPAATLGLLFYRGGLERYVSRLGLQTAKRVMLLGERFKAEQMLECGYLDRLLPSAEVLAEQVDEFARLLAGMAPLALLGMKKHLNRIAAGTLDAAEVARDIAQADASEDLREGALAWQQKRAPVFRGR